MRCTSRSGSSRLCTRRGSPVEGRPSTPRWSTAPRRSWTSAYSLRAAGISDAPRGENILDSGAHFYDVYETSDGRYVSIAPVEPKFYAELLDRIGLDAGEAPHSANRADWPASKARLAALFRTRTRDEWCAILEGTDACFAPVLGMDEAHRHPHNAARGTFVERDGIVQPNAAPRFDRTPGGIRSSPPASGSGTKAVLADWGFTPAEIDDLAARGIIGPANVNSGHGNAAGEAG